MFCLALIAAASAAFSYYPVDAVVAEAPSPVFALPENETVVASASSDGFPYLPVGSVVSSASSAAFDFGADAPDIVLQGLFAGVGTVERTASGYLVSLTDDLPVSAVRIPDNLGSVTIDLCGHDLFGINGADGEDALPGGNGEPAILIVASGALGAPTVLTVVDSRPDDATDVFGGKGGKGSPPGSDAAGIEIAADVQAGVAVDVDESVGVSQGQESPNPSCTVYVSDSGKTLGEEDPDLSQGFTVRTTGGVSADDFAGYCRRTPGEAPGVYAINFVCTRMPEGLEAPFAVVPGTFTIAVRPGPDAATGSVKAPSVAKGSDFLKENANASWKATSDSGCVFAGWTWAGEGPEPAAFAALSANERRNPSLSFRVAAGERVRPGDLVPTWVRIDEDAIVSVNLDTSALAVGTKSYVTATVSGLPNGFKFEAKSLRIVRDAKKALKDGGYTVKATVKNASGYSEVRTYALTVVAGEVTGIVEAAAPVATGVPVMLWCDAAKGSVKGTGVVAAGKRVSISATAKGGYVFAGWYADPGFAEPYAFADGKDYREASQAVAPVEALYLFARFVEKTTKADPIVWLRYAGCSAAGSFAREDTWYQGVDLPSDCCGILFDSLSKPTVKASGLPSGVQFDASALRFTGAPTKAGTFDVKVDVKNACGSTDALTIRVSVVALPDWAIGTFDGGGEEGIVSLTVGSTGRISGKWQTCAKAWTLTAPSFASFDGSKNAYRAVLSAKSGKEAMEIEVIWTESGAMAKDFSAWRNTWKQEPLKSLAAELKGRTFSDGNISFKIGANGTVSAQGVFSNGYKATCSSVLVPVEGQAGCFDIALCFPSVKGKFDGLSGVWRFVFD